MQTAGFEHALNPRPVAAARPIPSVEATRNSGPRYTGLLLSVPRGPLLCTPHHQRYASPNPAIVVLFTSSARTTALFVALFGLSAAQALTAPNVVSIDPNLVTSGQPSAGALAGLKAEGFEAVIYLAPLSVADAVKDEPALLSKQGIEFVHVPIPFGAPTEAHFEAVSAHLARLRDKKVLVHCQVNMRASTMVFLHRVVWRKESPSGAYEAVTRDWSPQGPWKDMAQGVLRKHGVEFEVF